MAGTNRAFSGAKFRKAIQSTFDMAAAVDTNDQATFYFPTVVSYGAAALDDAGVPFDPAAVATRTTPTPVKVPCGVEYFSSTGDSTVFGDMVPARAVITVLDEDYAQIEGCLYVALGGEMFKLVETEPPSALFNVGVYTMHFKSENTS